MCNRHAEGQLADFTQQLNQQIYVDRHEPREGPRSAFFIAIALEISKTGISYNSVNVKIFRLISLDLSIRLSYPTCHRPHDTSSYSVG